MPRHTAPIPALAFLLWSGILVAQGIPSGEIPPILLFPEANSRPTYFDVHEIRAAWELSRGAGIKVGILDHSFGYGTHEGLYAGGENFQDGDWGAGFEGQSHHGYWMASVLREVAPEVEIYALGTYSDDEGSRADAMVRAIDWAIEHDLDVLTYSASRFSEVNRSKLDAAVERAVDQGIVTTFIHYPHPRNLLPTWMGGPSGDDEREADLNVLHYDYSVIFTKRYADWLEAGSASGYRPFLSVSSTSPVTAGFVAMLRSVAPEMTPAECKQVLLKTSRPMEFEGHRSPRVVNIASALRAVTQEIDPRLRFLTSVLGKRWTGRYVPAGPDEQFDHIIECQPVLGGAAIRCTKHVPAVRFEMETTYYTEPGSDEVVFVSLTNRGQTTRGSARMDDNGFELLGSSRRGEFKQTFQVRPDGGLDDRFFLLKDGAWSQGHLIRYAER